MREKGSEQGPGILSEVKTREPVREPVKLGSAEKPDAGAGSTAGALLKKKRERTED